MTHQESFRTLCEINHVTLQMVADGTGLTFSTVSNVGRKGAPEPSLRTMIKLADYFQVPMDVMVGRTNPQEFINSHVGLTYSDIRKLCRETNYVDYLEKGTVPPLPKGMMLPWPYNLVHEIDESLAEHVLSKYQLEGLREALEKALTQRERECAINIYEDGMTLDDLAKQYNVTRERVRQILAKAVRKLRFSVMKNLIVNGFRGE